MKHTAKTHLPNPESDLHEDGAANRSQMKGNFAKVGEAFDSGKEALLDVSRSVHSDGSVTDHFHHTAADNVQPHHNHKAPR